ncbi:50S ribosomal protein L6 [Candidatus Roizmanbacteria bacterium]|nr:50S ribosomal protein L6 [Candidatus Roizmanbacteria bacterium]
MSKIGEKIIEFPQEVQIDQTGELLHVRGKAGEFRLKLPKELQLELDQSKVKIKRLRDDKKTRALHGLYRSLIANAVSGVQKPWEKRLEVVGTGYNVRLQGEDLVFKIGYSHPVTFKKVPGILFQIEGNNRVVVSGTDRQLVGQVAYQIKKIRKPDVYKGKGVKYEGEVLRIKPGKKAKAQEA